MKKKATIISDLRSGQKVSINGIPAEYRSIEKVRIPNFGKAEKIVFKELEANNFKYYNLSDGSKTLKSEKIKLIK
ncbi:hypothetical protein [Chryseobacterium terrae]|uniref:Uncharacterized protein n=1 Tax=Chryseobacterium terrae TaxID=3163299 RepID=A0ABW8Y8A9_9FLAO